MKYVKTFKDFQVSEGFKYHMDNGLDITNSVYRLGSDAYAQLFEETKKYWDEGNIILSDKAAWMAKNLEVGKDAVDSDGKKVKLDSPYRGGDKKFTVYHNSGKKDKDGNKSLNLVSRYTNTFINARRSNSAMLRKDIERANGDKDLIT